MQICSDDLPPITLILFFSVIAYQKLVMENHRNSTHLPSRHVVLLVLDGWPASFLNTFNPEARTRPIDALLARERVFLNMRTNAPWTSGYFATLYTGGLHRIFDAPLGWKKKFLVKVSSGWQDNLFGVLQRHGVKTRGLYYHRNGMPNTISSLASGYNGVCSFMLTSSYIPLLHALGLDYTMVFNGKYGPHQESTAQLLSSPRRISDYANILTELLLPEMLQMRTGSRQSFIIFHVPWPLTKPDVFAAWKHSLPASDADVVLHKWMRQDYRYDEEDAPYIERFRHSIDFLMDGVGEKIKEFLEEIRKNDLLEDTLLIFTADHGIMTSQGRIWYYYHPQEEVLRVPLIIYGKGMAGMDARNFATIDLGKTILDYFHCPFPFRSSAQSLFASGSKPCTWSVTNPSDLHREWFMVIYQGMLKYCFNIHPDGDGRSLKQVVDRFATTTVDEGPGVIREVLPELTQALRDYRLFEIPDKEIHANYRQQRLRQLE